MAAARLLQRLRRYDREKRQAAMLDFADLILLPARLLRADGVLRERLAAYLGSDPVVSGDLWIENNPSLPSADVSDLIDFIQDKFPGSAFLGSRATGGNG